MAKGLLERLRARRRSSAPSHKAHAATTPAVVPNVPVQASPRSAVIVDCNFQYRAHSSRSKEDITRPVPVIAAAASLSRSMSTNAIFQHRALDQPQKSAVRLVQICPDLSSTGRIQCRIRNTTFDIHYNCLLYTWSSSDGLQDIELIGQSFQIRRNLLDSLRHARGRFDAAEWFIDALCIDQRNVSERNHQVQQMADIYRYVAVNGLLNAQCRRSFIDGSSEMPLKLLSGSVGAAFTTSWHFYTSMTSSYTLTCVALMANLAWPNLLETVRRT
jgi:hypothetical protein